MKVQVVHAGSHAPSWQYAVELVLGDKKFRLEFTGEKSGADAVAAEFDKAIEDCQLTTFIRSFGIPSDKAAEILAEKREQVRASFEQATSYNLNPPVNEVTPIPADGIGAGQLGQVPSQEKLPSAEDLDAVAAEQAVAAATSDDHARMSDDGGAHTEEA